MHPLQRRAADVRGTPGQSNGAGAPVAGEPPHAVEIMLGKPLPGHRGDVSVIHLREPTFGDYIDCGPLMRQVISDDPDRPGKMRIEAIEDPAAIMRWMARLANLPETTLRLLAWRDARAVSTEVARLVKENDEGNSPAGPTT